MILEVEIVGFFMIYLVVIFVWIIFLIGGKLRVGKFVINKDDKVFVVKILVIFFLLSVVEKEYRVFRIGVSGIFY